MTHKQLHERYGIRGVDGTNVTRHLRGPLSIETALQVLKRDINPRPAVEKSFLTWFAREWLGLKGNGHAEG